MKRTLLFHIVSFLKCPLQKNGLPGMNCLYISVFGTKSGGDMCCSRPLLFKSQTDMSLEKQLKVMGYASQSVIHNYLNSYVLQ